MTEGSAVIVEKFDGPVSQSLLARGINSLNNTPLDRGKRASLIKYGFNLEEVSSCPELKKEKAVRKTSFFGQSTQLPKPQIIVLCYLSSLRVEYSENFSRIRTNQGCNAFIDSYREKTIFKKLGTIPFKLCIGYLLMYDQLFPPVLQGRSSTVSPAFSLHGHQINSQLLTVSKGQKLCPTSRQES